MVWYQKFIADAWCTSEVESLKFVRMVKLDLYSADKLSMEFSKDGVLDAHM
jgi:hypothetical protein